MRGILRRLNTGAIIFALTCLLGGAAAEARLVPKVDNFIFFLDQSGSMYMHHGTLKEVKMALAKGILKDMNELIPEWGYQGAFYLFAPFEPVEEPQTYRQNEFTAGIEGIKKEQEIFGRRTPLGAGIRDLDQVLERLNGQTAVILITDGGADQGALDPIREVLQVRLKYLQVRFYVISLAESEADAKLLEEIAQAGNGMVVEGAGLLDKGFGLQELVNTVFFEDIPEKPPEPRAVAVPGLKSVLFHAGKSEIGPEWKAVLDEDVSILKSYTGSTILIEGHTDAIGLEEKNQLVSERRAQRVRDYFIEKEISQEHMKVMGYGQLRPVATNDTAQGRGMNRRVEIKIVK